MLNCNVVEICTIFKKVSYIECSFKMYEANYLAIIIIYINSILVLSNYDYVRERYSI